MTEKMWFFSYRRALFIRPRWATIYLFFLLNASLKYLVRVESSAQVSGVPRPRGSLPGRPFFSFFFFFLLFFFLLETVPKKKTTRGHTHTHRGVGSGRWRRRRRRRRRWRRRRRRRGRGGWKMKRGEMESVGPPVETLRRELPRLQPFSSFFSFFFPRNFFFFFFSFLPVDGSCRRRTNRSTPGGGWGGAVFVCRFSTWFYWVFLPSFGRSCSESGFLPSRCNRDINSSYKYCRIFSDIPFWFDWISRVVAAQSTWTREETQ